MRTTEYDARSSPSEVVYRSVEDHGGCRACVALQRETWGEGFRDVVPASLLLVSRKVGGVVLGAFGEDDRLLGFVFGLAGHRKGRPVHWSHMLAVRPSERGQGIGLGLKLHQRRLLLDRGVTEAFWTFDPLVSRNAHINLNRLGTEVVEYVPHMYGDTGSPLHAETDTDRFVVRWELSGERVERALAGEGVPDPGSSRDAPAFSPAGDDGTAPDPDHPSAPPVLRLEIPGDVQRLRTERPESADRWRRFLRSVVPDYLDGGYRVQGLFRDPDSDRRYYVLRRPRHPTPRSP